MRIGIAPEMINWACERAGLPTEVVARRLPQLPEWLRGQKKPTLKQIERFASIVHAPVGFLFLPTPPKESVPIPDFRTAGNTRLGKPSPDLLDTIYQCQQRQEWYRDFALTIRETPYQFIGSATIHDDPRSVASSIRRALGFDIEVRRELRTWEEALRQFVAQADDAGVLVMVSGVVGNNTRRKLDPEEFRGFALCDELAPLVFINGSDTKSAQMFTLAHELAHIWLGQSALSDAGPSTFHAHRTEQWCNQVAAEVLVPLSALQREYDASEDRTDAMQRLARCFKVSTLVILRRLFDAGFLTRNEFNTMYRTELDRLLDSVKRSGGNYYRTQPARVSKRFARALIASTLEGQTLHRDAFRLLGVRKVATFHELGDRLGVM